MNSVEFVCSHLICKYLTFPLSIQIITYVIYVCEEQIYIQMCPMSLCVCLLEWETQTEESGGADWISWSCCGERFNQFKKSINQYVLIRYFGGDQKQTRSMRSIKIDLIRCKTAAGQRRSADWAFLQDACAFSQREKCGHMWPRPPPNGVWVIGSQDAVRTHLSEFRLVLKADHVRLDPSGRMFQIWGLWSLNLTLPLCI